MPIVLSLCSRGKKEGRSSSLISTRRGPRKEAFHDENSFSREQRYRTGDFEVDRQSADSTNLPRRTHRRLRTTTRRVSQQSFLVSSSFFGVRPFEEQEEKKKIEESFIVERSALFFHVFNLHRGESSERSARWSNQLRDNDAHLSRGSRFASETRTLRSPADTHRFCIPLRQ